MRENQTISRRYPIGYQITKVKPIMHKELYTRQEYFELFDKMDGKIKKFTEKLEDENKILKINLKLEKEKTGILLKKIMDMSNEFIKLSKEGVALPKTQCPPAIFARIIATSRPL